ncbi:MAG: flagellar basal-body MS-ring/collar protein FliF [Myxococcota bacterium]
MEPLVKTVKNLQEKLNAASARTRMLVAGVAILAAVAGAVVAVGHNADAYAYVFTNLSAEDSAEATAALKAAGIPHRLEAGGAAVSVPSPRVHDARLLLAASGIPRGGHVGFELFDKGDLGVSQFTQKVNLRRAIEGELARTISSLANIRNARVHVTLAETALRREDDREATAAVVVALRPGSTLSRRELAGIRHLVSSAVPGLTVAAVSVMDGSGAVLAGSDDTTDEAQAFQRTTERDLERRILGVLEPLVGVGGVTARVTAEVDHTRTDSTAELYDPETAVLRSERTVNDTSSNSTATARGMAGAVANQPQTAAAPSGGSAGNSSHAEETRNYEISRTTTVTRKLVPRVTRLSAAVVVNVGGRTLPPAEVARLADLARRAVGFDAARGDALELQVGEFAEAAPPTAEAPVLPSWALGAAAAAVGALAMLVLLFVYARSRQRRRRQEMPLALLEPGKRVAEIELAVSDVETANAAPAAVAAPSAPAETPALPDPEAILLAKAQELARTNPQRAALLLRAWLNADRNTEEPVHVR